MQSKRSKAKLLLYNILPFLLSAILIFALYFGIFETTRLASGFSEHNKNEESEKSGNSYIAEDAVYIATVKDGKLVIVSAGNNSIKRELNVWITVLPESDRLFLEEGIPLYSEREMNELIAYYTS